MSEHQKVNENSKSEQLEQFRSKDEGHILTTNQGLKVSEDEFSLKAGQRGPALSRQLVPIVFGNVWNEMNK